MQKEIKAKTVRVLYTNNEFAEYQNVTLFFTDTFMRMRGEEFDYLVPFTNVCEITVERVG
jgi:hypothetical protein